MDFLLTMDHSDNWLTKYKETPGVVFNTKSQWTLEIHDKL